MHFLTLFATAFIGSGIATAIATHWLTVNRAREEVLRAKLEELFLAVHGFRSQATASWMPYLSAMLGKISWDQANDIYSAGMANAPRHFERLEMLINLYFPEFLDLLQAFVAARDKISELRHAFKANYALQQSSPSKAKEFSDAIEVFDETGNMLLIMLSATSRKLIRPPSLFEMVKRLFAKRTDFTKSNGSADAEKPSVS